MKLLKIEVKTDPLHEEYAFNCPGCGCYHSFIVRWGNNQRVSNEERRKRNNNHTPLSEWQFNGNLDKPTFSPSLLYTRSDSMGRCHLFLRNGIIDFLSDCEHELKSKSVPLPELD